MNYKVEGAIRKNKKYGEKCKIDSYIKYSIIYIN